ncbi:MULTISPECIES: excalibur calcium-binding domain-containing protein [Nocardia]|uniref:excalibur calcium-binding domain-containing protein n=1 Tax=Nocardia TaxID=1817 RepID=UPI00331435DB
MPVGVDEHSRADHQRTDGGRHSHRHSKPLGIHRGHEPCGHEPAERPYRVRLSETVRPTRQTLLRGQPGYAPHLDRDNDGVACE